MSIKWRLTYLFLLATTIPMLIGTYVIYSDAKNIILQDKETEVSNIADLKKYEIESYFKERRADILIAQKYYNIITNLPILSRCTADRASEECVKAKKMLDEQLIKFKEIAGYCNIYLLSPEGKVVYAAADEKRYLDNMLPDPDNKAFGFGRKDLYLGDIFKNKLLDDTPCMYISAPILGGRDEALGVIVLDINMDFVYKLAQSSSELGKTGEVVLTKRYGDKILFLNPRREDPRQALVRTVRLGAKEAMPSQHAVQGENGMGLDTDYRGKNVVSAWRNIPLLDWGLVVKIDASEAFSEAYNFRNYVWMITALMSLLIVIVSMYLGRSISAPIRKLSTGIEAIGKGNLDYRTSLKSNDEIGHLSASLDKMALNLKNTIASRDELNREMAERKRVAEELAKRMKELELFNEVAVGRELKMIELKKKIAELESKLPKKG